VPQAAQEESESEIQLKDGFTERNAKITLKNNRDILIGKQAADCFVDSSAECAMRMI
jgi:hypothetical protein